MIHYLTRTSSISFFSFSVSPRNCFRWPPVEEEAEEEEAPTAVEDQADRVEEVEEEEEGCRDQEGVAVTVEEAVADMEEEVVVVAMEEEEGVMEVEVAVMEEAEEEVEVAMEEEEDTAVVTEREIVTEGPVTVGEGVEVVEASEEASRVGETVTGTECITNHLEAEAALLLLTPAMEMSHREGEAHQGGRPMMITTITKRIHRY